VRTCIDIDDNLMREAMRYSGTPAKKSAVEAGLRLLAATHAQGSVRRVRGRVRWEVERKTYSVARRRALARMREGLDLEWTPLGPRDGLHRR